jgi:uncharacterized protein YhjY with autotransporter beta-barrel domain
MRENRTVRMAAETKEWVDEIIIAEQKELNEKIRKGLVEKLEGKLYKKLGEELVEELSGISLNITLNVTIGSVIEKAYKTTRSNDYSEWNDLATSMKKLESTLDINKKGATPRISLETEVIKGLETYQEEFQKLKIYAEAKRAVNFGYVIKLVLYAYWKSLLVRGACIQAP